MSLNLSAPIRTAIIGDTTITDELDAYLGSFPVFTKTPLPDDAPTLSMVVHSQFQAGNEDGVDDHRPIIVRDVTTYGRRSADPSQDQYRTVETIAFAVRELFHRKRDAITVTGWSVVDIVASGPSPAPTDDEQTAGIRVELTIRLARKN